MAAGTDLGKQLTDLGISLQTHVPTIHDQVIGNTSLSSLDAQNLWSGLGVRIQQNNLVTVRSYSLGQDANLERD